MSDVLDDSYIVLLRRVARLWRQPMNTFDIARALKITEPEVIRLIADCKLQRILT